MVETFSGPRSLANSGGLMGWPETQFDWVRPGLMLYGVSPFAGNTGVEQDLRPVMTLESKLIAVNRVERGAAIGYSGPGCVRKTCWLVWSLWVTEMVIHAMRRQARRSW